MSNMVKNKIENPTPLLFTVSDGTGETALSIVRAVKVQFEQDEIEIERFNKIRHREELLEILMQAQEKKATIVATLVDPDLRIFLINRSMHLGVKVVDVLFPLLDTLSEQLGKRPNAIPGLLRKLDESYFKRISAIEYTVRHDDGMQSYELKDADIVLIGVSRTSKTPLSMYLGHKGYKVANIPVILGVEPPEELFQIDQHKIIALMIDFNHLSKIRKARISSLSLPTDMGGEYAASQSVFEELEWSLTIFKKHKKWPVVDVTGKALEESAVEIEDIILSRYPELKDDIHT
jgi:regulator of PEP synthase PpsR (kinase-PPPase family)